MNSIKTRGKAIQIFEEISENSSDLVCLSHLRWNYVYQRPQHLMSRFAQDRRVFFIEEPELEENARRYVVHKDASGVYAITPYLSKDIETRDKYLDACRSYIDQIFSEFNINRYFLWYYTPMAVPYTRHLKPELVIYDCMDELTAFKGAPQVMKGYEKELLDQAKLVFTGGQSLYEAKKTAHPSVHAFPSSIDAGHFGLARKNKKEPSDQAGIPHPRLGFFGVIDERMDLNLLNGIAEARPDWHLVMLGPVTKIDKKDLPRQPNIHYLGKKSYQDLPAYLAGWDVAILPFAQNESTRFISPTKIPEYLAGGKPVVSTPIRDVVRPYGEQGLVWIAENVAKFVLAVESAIAHNARNAAWLRRVDKFLSRNSWDDTWARMNLLIQSALSSPNGNGSRETNLSIEESPLTSQSISMPPIPYANGGRKRRSSGGSKAFDYLIVGAGYAGSILAERLACGSGKKVLLIDKRPHIAGNAYDTHNPDGILIHKYGPHIFHTNSREVFAYLSRFTQWRPYEHRVRASVDGQIVPMPINLDTVNQIYGLNLTSFELEKFFDSIAEPKDKIVTSEDVVVSKIGRTLYEKFFRNYTRKQWELDPSELDASVTSRVPIRMNRDDRYFTDTYQSMPLLGFTHMFENILDHPNIHILLNTDYRDIEDYLSYREMIYTGPIDEFFDFCYGKLPYRSLEFKFETLEKEFHQPVAVINYPNEHLYTRVTEFKHLTGQAHPKTSLVYEFPCSEGDPYYPIPRPENAELYRKYRDLAEAVTGIYFAGRLATYKYYNMDQVAAQALTLYTKITGVPRSESLISYTPNKFVIDMPCSLQVMQGID